MAMIEDMCNFFEITTLRQYFDLQIDVLGLMDVMEDGKIARNEWGLDPVCYISIPGLAWQARMRGEEQKSWSYEKRCEVYSDYDSWHPEQQALLGEPNKLLCSGEEIAMVKRGARWSQPVAQRYNKCNHPGLRLQA